MIINLLAESKGAVNILLNKTNHYKIIFNFFQINRWMCLKLAWCDLLKRLFLAHLEKALPHSQSN